METVQEMILNNFREGNLIEGYVEAYVSIITITLLVYFRQYFSLWRWLQMMLPPVLLLAVSTLGFLNVIYPYQSLAYVLFLLSSHGLVLSHIRRYLKRMIL